MSNPLETVDIDTLLPLVRQATGHPILELDEWSWQPIHEGAGEGLGIYRYLGQATDRRELVNWSLILKVFGESAEATPLTAWNYWRREVDVYQSDFLVNLPGGIRAPQCFAVQEQGHGRIGLWLEDIVEEKPDWSIADYGQVAYDLGRFNGSYLTDRPIPAFTWLSQQWLRGWVEHSASAIALLHQTLDHPWIRRLYPPDVAKNMFKLWEERDWYLQILENLPQTLCHMDVFRRNLFSHQAADESRETVAIDWAFVGPGAVGEELVPVVGANIAFLEVDASNEMELEKQVIEGYLAGLSHVGWQGDPRQVRLGYTAAASLRYTVGVMGNALPFVLDDQLHPIIEQFFQKPVGELCDYWAEYNRQTTNRLPVETRELAQELGLA